MKTSYREKEKKFKKSCCLVAELCLMNINWYTTMENSMEVP